MVTRDKVEGLREVEKALMDLGNHVTARGVGRRVLMKRGKPLADAMNSAAPDDQKTAGGLNQSYTASTKLNKAQRKAMRKTTKSRVEVYVGSTSPGKAVGQEFGVPVSNVPAQPHARPAWEGGKRALLDGIADDLGEEVVKTATRLAKRRAKG